MKSLLIFIPLALLALFAVPDTSKIIANTSPNDTLSTYASSIIKTKKLLLNEQETTLHSALSNLRDTVFITNVKVIKDTQFIHDIKEKYKIVEKPIYYKVVHSLYTSRGYHEALDTVKINN